MDLLRTLATDCQASSGANLEEIKKIKFEDMDENDEKLAKFLYCMEINTTFIDEEGNIQFDTVFEYLRGMGMKDAEIDSANKICGKLEKTAPLPKLSVLYFKCYRKILPENTKII